ncbi:MAG: carboxylesterase family protein [Bacteroidales bacterium]|nr:carboxylesterase family protein [Bacteroidales bacterium]
MKNLLIIVILINATNVLAQPCGNRYLKSIFSSVNKNTITFDIQPSYKNTADTLFADIYTPIGDTETNRAGVIFVHGGGFVGGTRNGGNIPLLCENLAKRGYIVASIDYRLGVLDTTANQKGKAQIRAIQDLKSFIRFSKQNAATLNLDVNKLFIAGSSAGGATCLATAFMSYSERPSYVDTSGVGSIDGRGNINGQSTKIKGVFSMWGGVSDTTWIQTGDIPVGCIQSIYDPCIPWTYIPSSCNVPGYPVFGSSSINQRANNLGIYSRLYGFNTSVHDYGLDNLNGLDTTIVEMTTFFYNILCGTTTGLNENFGNNQSIVYPNPFSTEVNIAPTMKDFQYKLYDLHGRIIKQGQNEYNITTSDLPSGVYVLKVFNRSNNYSFKIMKEYN